ncbi:MAG: NADH-quinone oxidoreductase subunit L [Pseudomonadota bacterium]|nr:NADH-quinone oxidoreductase subunit L [Pseudomonadota bacterium]
MIILLVFLPLLAAVSTGLLVFAGAAQPRLAHKLTCGGMVISALLAGGIFAEFASVAMAQQDWHELFGPGGLVYKVQLAPWIASGDFTAGWTLRVDALTAVMLVVVTWVSAVVHLYSVGYMHEDPHQPRFMCYLSLFTFFMLMLVTSDNLVQLFLGWEGVGLCSYLLIGFWFKKPSANTAAIKAFIVNRVGDFGFALGIFGVFALFGTIHFDPIFASAKDHVTDSMRFLGHDFPALTLLCILLFIGAMGKSAQIGLHTWLPDAMEGPTPVSALIHAATMVTAGVFMVARLSPIFDYSKQALDVVCIVGGLTCFFAATVGLVQNDIKRVIAYSTCSQLGYMFFACGAGAYAAGIFHLMTHAFFKALLFLGAGSVIHGMSGEQDMRHMGGIWRKMPITYLYMWIGSLALAGIPFFAGYYSKDSILAAAYAAGPGPARWAFWFGIVAAFMTAFYSWRLLFMTFHGKPRASKEVMHHVHESPGVMLKPLALLAFGAIFSGVFGYYALEMVSPDGDFWQHALVPQPILEEAHHVPDWVEMLPLVMGLSGIAIAWLFYILRPALPGKLAAALPFLYRFLLNKWYFDELYDLIFVRPAKKLGHYLWKFWDEKIIDGLGPNGAALATVLSAMRVSRLQTGYVYHYAFAMLVGFMILMSWVVFL